MASDASGFELSKQHSVALDCPADHFKASRDRAFFLRVTQSNGVLSDLMKSSAIKLAESQKLLADVDALLRR